MSEWKMLKSDKEKKIQVVKLLHPGLEPDDLFNNDPIESFNNDGSESDDEEKDDTPSGILSTASVQKHNHSILRQAYGLVEAMGPVGLMQKDMVQQLGLARLEARIVLRVLLRLQMVNKIIKDVGKGRVFM
jgi:hypothetical protein